MKRILFGLLVIMLVLLFSGCGVKEKLEEKAGEALAEKMLGADGESDVDIDGDKVVIKGKDGEEITFGETQWPTSDLAKTIPQFKDGKVTSVMEMSDSLLVTLEEVSKEDFTDYLEEIQKIFTEEAYNMQSEDNITYGAENEEDIGILLMYYISGESLSITVTQA